MNHRVTVASFIAPSLDNFINHLQSKARPARVFFGVAQKLIKRYNSY